MVFIFTLMYKYIINVFEKTKEILFYQKKNTNEIKINLNDIKLNLIEIKTQNNNLENKLIEMENDLKTQNNNLENKLIEMENDLENNIKKIYFENELIKKYLSIEEKINDLNYQVNHILNKN